MTQNKNTSKAVRRRIAMERTYDAPIEDVWELWTTKEGIESWWGPDGFAVTVEHLELRPGGELRYFMTAVEPDKIEFMKQAGMQVSQPARLTFTEILPPRRLAYVHAADFIPGVDSYDVATVVELTQGSDGVRMVLTFDAMHSDEWTNRAVEGWTMELEKLRSRLAERR